MIRQRQPMEPKDRVRLKLLPYRCYADLRQEDPIRFYYWPLLGRMYRRRVELCLAECRGGRRVLEVGCGSGVTFLNLHELYQEIYGLDLTARVAEVTAAFQARQIPVFLQTGNVLNMPYSDDFFDTVLLISILEHLRPQELLPAFQEIRRVLKPGGQVVYGVPVERPFMVLMFRLLGYDIRQHHFSTEQDVAQAAASVLQQVRLIQMPSTPSIFGSIYEVGHFGKSTDVHLTQG